LSPGDLHPHAEALLLPLRTLVHCQPPGDAAAWQDWLASLPEVAATIDPSQLLQTGRNQIFHTRFRDQPLVVKRFFNHGIWKKVVYRFTSSKARRSFAHSLRLIEAGLHSPQPIAWREDWRGPWLAESFYVCAFLPTAWVARQHLRDPAVTDLAAKAALIGSEVARMHEAGIVHLDLTPGNLLLVETGPQQWQLNFVDNNRMRFGPVSLARGIRSFVQLELVGIALHHGIKAYADARGFDLMACQREHAACVRRYHLKWYLKNSTRPWRRKFGL